MFGQEDNAVFLPKQEPVFESEGFPGSVTLSFRNMFSLLKNNDDIFPLPQTSPSASTPKTPPYTGYPVQTVSHIAWQPEYSCAVTPQVRQTGNRLSGLAGTAYASLLT